MLSQPNVATLFRHAKWRNLFALAWLALCLISCKPSVESEQKNAQPYNPYLIRFVTINSPNTYFVNSQNEYAGLEYDLAKRFQAYLGTQYKIEFIVVDSFAKVLPMLLRGEADIAGADISITEQRKASFDFSTPFYEVQPLLSYHQNNPHPPTTLKALKGKVISVPKGTSFAERLSKLNETTPGLKWEEVEHVSSEQLLESLAQEEIDFTVADHHLLAVMQYYYPQLKAGMKIGNMEQIAWAIAKSKSPEKLKQINAFFASIQKDGTLRNLIDRYHGNTKRLNPLDVTTFLSKSRTLLPKYTRLFKNAQEITDIDWRLLAAVSYQESHWDTYSTSPTNVRGLMMLTEGTSDMMNVTDRLDPKQSIMAGAKYILWLKERIPERVPEPDRTFMTLAAYNIGVGHLEDARVLAQRLNLNPDSWADIKKTFVMLNDATYYINAKHGYCSCGAPVIYTESIRSYYQIMEKHFPAYQPDIDPYKIAGFDMPWLLKSS